MSRSSTVIARCEGTVLPSRPAASRRTAGREFRNPARDRILPARSCPVQPSINAATEVTGLVIEAMRNSVSGRIGACVSISLQPISSACTISPWREVSVTTPASSPRIDEGLETGSNYGELGRIETLSAAAVVTGQNGRSGQPHRLRTPSAN